MNKISLDIQCKSCKGTGLYGGMGERGNCAVVCSKCKGSGCYKYEFEYEEFTIRKPSSVEWVYEINPGIAIGDGNGYKFSDFGGMPFVDWMQGIPFPIKSENRKFTCPTWWYQSADYKRKPKWKECDESLGYTFSKCPYFGEKQKCWERWDAENKDQCSKLRERMKGRE